MDEGTDHLILDVSLPDPAILLITDTYSTGWRALEVGPNAPASYAVLPADYVVRAIALPAGSRRLRIEYSPLGYRAGRWVSGISLALFLVVVAVHTRRRVQDSTSSRGSMPSTDR